MSVIREQVWMRATAKSLRSPSCAVRFCRGAAEPARHLFGAIALASAAHLRKCSVQLEYASTAQNLAEQPWPPYSSCRLRAPTYSDRRTSGQARRVSVARRGGWHLARGLGPGGCPNK